MTKKVVNDSLCHANGRIWKWWQQKVIEPSFQETEFIKKKVYLGEAPMQKH